MAPPVDALSPGESDTFDGGSGLYFTERAIHLSSVARDRVSGPHFDEPPRSFRIGQIFESVESVESDSSPIARNEVLTLHHV